MALQGALDTFALPDVLRLLAATKKTGRLRVEGDRGRAAVWLDTGMVVGIEAAARSGDLTEGAFELLRFSSGTFEFEVDAAPGDPLAATDVEDLLREAEALVAEWRAIEAVVPSVHAWVTLERRLPGESVTLDRVAWETVTQVGSGATVATLGERLALGELAVARSVADLVELGVVAVGEAPAQPPSDAPPSVQPVGAPEPSDPFRREPDSRRLADPAPHLAPPFHGFEAVPAGSDHDAADARPAPTGPCAEDDDEDRSRLLRFLGSTKN